MQPREHWRSRFSFIMAAVGSAVGLGNIWRFPATCAQHGGGAFLLPYFVALVSVGIPLMILEFSLGHRMQHAAPIAYQRIRPSFNWIGWWAVLLGFVIVCYYTVIIASCCNYLVYSVQPSITSQWGQGAKQFLNTEHYARINSELADVTTLGGLRWHIVAALAVSWIAIYLMIHKGVRLVGKVVLVTVPLPIVLGAILLVRGVFLDGAAAGLTQYLKPNFDVLTDPAVWLAAYGQIFFSLSIGFGVMIAYASYLKRKSDIVNNAFMTSLINCGFSFFIGFAVFSVLGYLATVQGIPVSDASVREISGGPSLLFVAYPAALAKLPYSALFGVIFFITMLTLGIDSAFSIVEGVTASVMEKFNLSRHAALALVCVAGFLGGLVFCTQNGMHILGVTDSFMNYGMVVSALLACIVVGWFYGAEKMRHHVNANSDIQIGRWWDVMIRYVAPVVLVLVVVGSLIKDLSKPGVGSTQFITDVAGWLPLIVTLVLSVVLMELRSAFRPATTKSMVKVLVWLALMVAGFRFYRDYPAVVMGGFGCVFLYGGLGYCIHRARKARREAQAAGRDAAEVQPAPAGGDPDEGA